MKSIQIIARSLYLFAIMLPVVASAQEACITVRVRDERGNAVSNAEVSAGFDTNIKPGWGWGAGQPNRVYGRTDTNGLCVLSGHGDGASVGLSVKAHGYYGGSDGVRFTNVSGVIAKKWQPWNPVVDVVLKKVGNPVPMYARWVRDLTIPKEGEALGYDLLKGDWVTPHGIGEIPDVYFKLDRQPEHEVENAWGNQPRAQKVFDVVLHLSFPDENDGILLVRVPHHEAKSSLRLPAMAPETGYASNLVKRIAREQGAPPFSNVDDDANYVLRVRTKRDSDGRVVSALYGKIHGDFDDSFYYGKLRFRYYLNPTPNDRNIEFDPSQNLFTDLPSVEQVRDP